jgi:polysaccharide biosynthesis PFTS motif protein
MSVKYNKKSKKIIVFEEISYFWLLVAFYYVSRRIPVYYFRINRNIEKRSIVKELCDTGKITRFKVTDIGFNNLYELNDIVLKDIEENFCEVEKTGTIRFFENLVGDEYFRNAYKKGLAFTLFELYRMNLHLNVLKKDMKIAKDTIYFYPGKTFIELGTLPFVKRYIKNEFSATISGKIIHGILHGINKAKWILVYCAFPFWILVSIEIPTFKKISKLKYNVGIRVGANDWAPGNKYRTFDFLIDGKSINSENTVFCSEDQISDEYKKRIRGKKYHMVEIRKILKNVDMDYIRIVFFGKFFPVYLKCLSKSFFENISTLVLTAKLFRTYLLWSAFEQKYEISHYVTYSEYIPEDILRNIFLKKNGVRTWMYEHSISAIDSYEPKEKKFINVMEAFYYLDSFVVWGKGMEKYKKRYPHNIKNFEKLGCFWSEFVRIILEEKRNIDVLNIAREKFFKNNEFIPEKIIGVFDVTAGGDAPLDETDMFDFINAIFTFLDDHPKFGIIFKNKFTLKILSEFNPNLIEIYKKIRDHPRCYLTDELNSDPSETIAASDFIISASFTSPTIEALCSRKKAIYYAPNNKFRGTYYDQIPHFVAHDYSELKEMVEYWLNKMTDMEFNCLLDRYVLGELDQYLDGRAITRFRAKLVEK